MSKTFSFQKLLLVYFAFIGSLIVARIIYSGSWLFVFLAWNLFLAYIPLAVINYLVNNSVKQKWKQVMLFSIWLLFFPNALYIITDLVHLDIDTSVPKWFDAILLFSSSIVSLVMAFASLYKAELFLKRYYSKRTVAFASVLLLFAGSFGVYLGRFLRWNSWDIVRHPFGLAISIADRFIFPFQHGRTWGITILLTALFYLLYNSIKKLPGYLSQAIV